MRKFKHKRTGKIVEQSGSLRSYTLKRNDNPLGKQVNFIPEFVENSNDWEEIFEYPIGTKVRDCLNPPLTYIKTVKGWEGCLPGAVGCNDNNIGVGKRFQVIEEKESKGTPSMCVNIINHLIDYKSKSSEAFCKRCHKEVSLERMCNCILPAKEEPSWRITAFRHKVSLAVTVVGLPPCYNALDNQLRIMKEGGYMEIYSVEVKQFVPNIHGGKDEEWVEYKIGDKSQVVRDLFTIKSFTPFHNNTVNEVVLANFEEGEQYSMTIEGLRKLVRLPLFQLPDENGKMIDIYEEYRYFQPVLMEDNKHTYDTSEYWHILQHFAKSYDKSTHQNCFATEKAALQYIDLNKKVFSKQDVKKACNDVMTRISEVDDDDCRMVLLNLKSKLGL